MQITWIPIIPEVDGNNAFNGTPMGDWLYLVNKVDSGNVLSLSVSKELGFCVSSVYGTCPDCSGNDTTRTKQPDNENISEFWCFDCGKYFTAVNP